MKSIINLNLLSRITVILVVFVVLFFSTSSAKAQSTPYKNHTVPGIIQAEDYDNGGQGVAFNDIDSSNRGGSYRFESVDIKSGVNPNEYTVGWNQTGEWLHYTVNVQTAGYYVMTVRTATDQTDSPNFSVYVDGSKKSTVNIPSTGGYASLQSITGPVLNLTAGQHVIRIETNKQWFDLDYFIFESLGTTSACVSDFDGDLVTDLSDYSILVKNFFSTAPSPANTDITRDGTVDISDYSAFILSYFKVCNPNPTPTPTPSGQTQPTPTPIGSNQPTPTGSSNTLKGAAQKTGRYIGAEISAGQVWSGQDPQYFQVLEREFNTVVPGNDMKMTAISRGANNYSYGDPDRVVNYATSKNLPIHAHTLVWFKNVPSWLESSGWSNAQVEAWLETYIKNVVGRYKGKIQHWDVVNEPVYFKPSSGEVRERTESFWYQKIGPSYIEKAFRWAHETDPNAKLFINDYSTEWDNAKTDYLLNMVRDLKNKGVPIDGVGFQVHTHVDVHASYDQVYRSLKKFTDLGLEVSITEMDVRIDGEVTQAKLQTQAEIYTDVVRACKSLPKCVGITIWGVTDKYSWLGADRAGLLFDINYNKKPAYFSVLNELNR